MTQNIKEKVLKANEKFLIDKSAFNGNNIKSVRLISEKAIDLTLAEVVKILDGGEVKILLPTTATRSERVLMAHAVDIHTRKIKEALGIK